MDFSTVQNELNKNKQMEVCCYKVDDVNGLVLYYDDVFTDKNTTYKYKNIVYDTEKQQPIFTQFNQPINGIDNIKTFIENNEINEEVKVSFCYEGTHIVVFNHNNKWFISTRKCLDARDSKWNGISHYDMFMETIKGQFNLNDLNKDYCYHFNLVHSNNYRSVKYTTDNDFMILDLLFITEKYTMKEIEINEETFPATDFIVDQEKEIIKVNNEKLIEYIKHKNETMISLIDYNKQKELIMNSDAVDKKDKLKKLDERFDNVFLDFEGYAIVLHTKADNKIVVCKIQNPFYTFTYKHPVSKFNLSYPKYDILYTKFLIEKCKERQLKPIVNKQMLVKQVNNTHGVFNTIKVDLGKCEDEVNYLISLFNKDKVNNAMINMSHNMNNLSYLIRDMYFQFMKPSDLYSQIPDSYKTIKYLIHGVYQTKLSINKAAHSGEKVGVTVDLVYEYLMNYDPDCIKQLLIDYPAMVRIMYKSWGQNKRKFYYPIKFPKNIMKLNEITRPKKL